MMWKKERLFQMVADLRSPKRRRSLVVQTGFPTSLIDLFVKNRDRFNHRTHHPRRKTSRFHPVDQFNDTISNSTSSVVNRTDVSCRVDPVNDTISNSSSVICTDDELSVLSAVQREEIDEKHAEDSGIVVGQLPRGGCGSVLAAAVFAVMGLAVCGSTKLAVGVTLLAFVLLFLECVGKRVGCLVRKAWCDARSRLGCAMLLVLRSDVAESECSIEEVVSCCGNVCIDEGADQRSVEYMSVDETHLCKKSKSGKKAKMGAMFMKRLVSKRSRLSSKKHECETVPEPMPKASVEVERRESILRLPEVSENKCDKQEGDGIVTSSVGGKKGAEYLVLFLIALAGLVGGRVLALLLIVTWCFVLKFIMCWSRSGSANMNVSMKRCSLAISL